ncbi:tumor protein p63-regulated gene 1 protein isoform X2 [Saccopteryx bilineata]|uniref:tumor protein p63-regulated gene 1 protein isoform X2 n=1 Tax=Saccopteryx bilineata TaxID=59482 RepID=UPI00338D3B7B
MSMIGSFDGFQPVSLKQEGDDQPSETDQLSMEEGDPGKDPAPGQISRQPSVTESTLYPNPYHRPYISRKYFVTRPGAVETAVEDLRGHIAKTSGETIQGFWLLTEIDHWNNEKEKILLVTEKTLLICKYDFIMLSCVQLQQIPLSAIYRICLGKFAFPGISLDNKKQGAADRLLHVSDQDPPGMPTREQCSAHLGHCSIATGAILAPEAEAMEPSSAPRPTLLP